MGIQTSFVSRFEKLVTDDFFEQNNIDTFFIFGGTNDSWIDSPIGEPMFEGWQEDDLLCVSPAVSYLFWRIRSVLPKAKIISLITSGLKKDMIDGMKKSAERFGVESLQLENISMHQGHPNKEGMMQIKNQILSYLTK